MKHTFKVLSLFDGISCAQQALKELAKKNPKYRVTHYYASEIEKRPIEIAMKNFPHTQQIGDVTKVEGKNFRGIDLLIGGSPCQDLSVAKNDRKGLVGDRSKLFFEYLRILKEAKPKYFVLENVASMSKANRDIITQLMGVEPIMIDAALVSAQSRKRLFWTNIPGIKQPKDKGIMLKDIIEYGYTEKEKSYPITATYNGACPRDYFLKHQRQLIFNKPIQIGAVNKGMSGRVYSLEGKSVTLKALGGGGGAKTGLYLIGKGRGKNKGYISSEKVPTLTSSSWEYNNFLLELKKNGYTVRKLTPTECERLQSLPDGYTAGIPKSHQIACLGNAFNVEVIKHILKHI